MKKNGLVTFIWILRDIFNSFCFTSAKNLLFKQTDDKVQSTFDRKHRILSTNLQIFIKAESAETTEKQNSSELTNLVYQNTRLTSFLVWLSL